MLLVFWNWKYGQIPALFSKDQSESYLMLEALIDIS